MPDAVQPGLGGWKETATAIEAEAAAGFVAGFGGVGFVPKATGDFFVVLIEAFAVVGVFASANGKALTLLHFEPPIGIGQGLAGGADEVSLAVSEDGFALFEVAQASGRDDRRRQALG